LFHLSPKVGLRNIGPKANKNSNSFSNSPPEASGAAVAFSSVYGKKLLQKAGIAMTENAKTFASKKKLF